VLGSSDIEFLDDSKEWVGVTPLYEEGFVALRCQNGRMSDTCFLLSPQGHVQEIGDLKTHVRDSLLWEA
jgi:hypothetical protein